MRQLIALRTRHPVLTHGDIDFLDPDNPHVFAFVRSRRRRRRCWVANLSRLAQHVELDLRERVGHAPVEVFGLTRFAPIGDPDYQTPWPPTASSGSPSRPRWWPGPTTTCPSSTWPASPAAGM